MSFDDLNTRLGVGALIGAAILAFWGIPHFVSSPSNVGNIILSPTFWPYALAGFLALVGLGLILTPTGPLEANAEAAPAGAPWLRLVGLAAIMGVMLFALPRLGMVWTSMLAFVATAYLFRTRYPRAALICAVLIPLVLYAFFAHVAGVAIPQGDFVRLP